MNIGVVIGSARPGRIGDKITQWILQSITAEHNLKFEVIDLAEWDLPLCSEPGIPALGKGYSSEKIRQWSEKIDSKQGFIFVTPQYNWGYPAVLKNAIDYLFNEWKTKPALIASYANRGGGKAAGQLRQVLDGLHMRVVETMIEIKLDREMIDENGLIKAAYRESYKDFDQYTETINKAILELQEKLNKDISSEF